MRSEVQLFSISRRTRFSPSLSPCLMFPRDAFLNDGEDLGSSSSSITFEAAGVTILCLFVPLLKPRNGCATFRIAPSVACFISEWGERLSIFSFLLLMLVIVKEPCSILVASAPAVKCQTTPEKTQHLKLTQSRRCSCASYWSRSSQGISRDRRLKGFAHGVESTSALQRLEWIFWPFLPRQNNRV